MTCLALQVPQLNTWMIDSPCESPTASLLTGTDKPHHHFLESHLPDDRSSQLGCTKITLLIREHLEYLSA